MYFIHKELLLIFGILYSSPSWSCLMVDVTLCVPFLLPAILLPWANQPFIFSWHACYSGRLTLILQRLSKCDIIIFHTIFMCLVIIITSKILCCVWSLHTQVDIQYRGWWQFFIFYCFPISMCSSRIGVTGFQVSIIILPHHYSDYK